MEPAVEALFFYANPDNWVDRDTVRPGPYSSDKKIPKVERDCGVKARRALNNTNTVIGLLAIITNFREMDEKATITQLGLTTERVNELLNSAYAGGQGPDSFVRQDELENFVKVLGVSREEVLSCVDFSDNPRVYDSQLDQGTCSW